ncbi:hypothetical protein SAMN05444682_10357 [Parapedobacter indicus]|uniref:Uncharacterized protein n=1 Tax=Parapedobacter indicus TaxID=1477437 RepID=A0A1I3GP88_9SPHI|nr:hypothetical protein CLV26_10358 [Parapedobacter indicus]SFI25298.1 hypothetical protein SAMN05444682_10357 [Parapedobacter indicus]
MGNSSEGENILSVVNGGTCWMNIRTAIFLNRFN